ncbi:Serine carboxypeptidase-like protein 10 [Elsinoe fawcettii]|nr:Serine carboxypeptidase-like protein 10 [Elsinoe fawcettii]
MMLFTYLSILISVGCGVVCAQNEGSPACTDTSCFRFYNNNTASYLVSSLPLVDFPIGELYTGNVPIDTADPTRTLFFAFKPATNAGPVKQTTIWLNGGPGCSSLTGFFQENGPIVWQQGTLGPVENPYAWNTLTNMLFVEYPVGVGFTTGLITAFDEEDIAKDFVGFYKNWQKLFGIENYQTYVTGESYAGRYVPYIAAEMLQQNDPTYFNVAGTLIYSGTIGAFTQVQERVPAAAFARAKQQILNLNDTFLQTLDDVSQKCGYTEYMDKYLQFPPPSLQPTSPAGPEPGCDTYELFFQATDPINPCLSPYDISSRCPKLYDPLQQVVGNIPTAYFNRTDVREAIHAPANFLHDVGNITGANQVWFQCAIALNHPFLPSPDDSTGPQGLKDLSPDPIQDVLPFVTESTNRTLIVNGAYDAVILSNGTLLAIQNMTWNGALGFQQAPSDDFVVPNQGILGTKHFERGLMWIDQAQGSHLTPQTQPLAALRHLQWLLGMIDDL